MSLGKGIKLSTGFDLNAKSPLDSREWFKTIAERDTLPDINLYEGLKCFVEETKHNYQYIDGEWVDKDIGGGSGTGSSESIKEIEYGETEPTDENISIWVDTSNDAGVMQSFADALLQEFRSTIADLYKEIADLKKQNKKLEARVTYLEMNGGGSGGGDKPDIPDTPIEPETNDIIMINENNYVLTFEDGSIMCFDNVETETTTDIVIADEGGNILTFEDGSIMCFNIEITNDIILINELEEILIDENNNILIE